jgi:hypothetical protein
MGKIKELKNIIDYNVFDYKHKRKPAGPLEDVFIN